MKYICFQTETGTHVGALTETGVVDLTALGFPARLNEIITGGAAMREKIEAALAARHPALAPDTLTYSNVVENPSKILCVGLNYRSHAEETGGEAPKQPVFFSKFSDTLTPSGAEVVLPEWQRCYDYEAELVIVIGKPCYHVSPEAAADCIFGYTVGNDLSARDCQFLSNQWLSGKSFPGFAPAGPAVVTADTFRPEQSNAIRCLWNGSIAQDGNTNDMIFSCTEIIVHASKYFALNPGDLIFTGTPAGVILGKPKGTRVWMKKGDRVSVEIENICILETKFI